MAIEHGNFSTLAAHYNNRPGYSDLVLKSILALHGKPEMQIDIVDVGAGTGKLTEHLRRLPVASVMAVEPNDEMREEGIKYISNGVTWLKGSGEATNLPSGSADWILMGSSFHWVQPNVALGEFHRVLRKDGLFTSVWNPRDLERSELQSRIDKKIKEMIPELRRVSSGAPKSTKDWYQVLTETGDFGDVIFMEARHSETMTPERYMGVWHSVNDIQVQAGSEQWQNILSMIQQEIAGLKEIVVPYCTRAWTARRITR